MIQRDDSHFAADWLKLREPVDHRSRAHELAVLTNDFLRREMLVTPTVVDLGAGLGSNLRYLRARLDGPLRWRLLDRDPELLAAIRVDDADQDAITLLYRDLSVPLEPILAGATLVTASALLDLASADWIESLCRVCAKIRAAVLMALTIDGRITFTNSDPDDALVRAAVARDQRRDKGLGTALGAAAASVLVDSLVDSGYAVTVRRSDWNLEAADAGLVWTLTGGWREAARRQSPGDGDAIAAWAERRTQAVIGGRERLVVGHVDVLGLPGATRQDSYGRSAGLRRSMS